MNNKIKNLFETLVNVAFILMLVTNIFMAVKITDYITKDIDAAQRIERAIQLKKQSDWVKVRLEQKALEKENNEVNND